MEFQVYVLLVIMEQTASVNATVLMMHTAFIMGTVVDQMVYVLQGLHVCQVSECHVIMCLGYTRTPL